MSIVFNLGRIGYSEDNTEDKLNVDMDSEENSHIDDFEYEELKTKWSNDIKEEYKNAFSTRDINILIQRIDSLNPFNVTQDVINDIVKDLGKLYIDPAKHISICKKVAQNERKVKAPKTSNKPWFDKDCKNKRAEYMRIKNRLKKIKTDEARGELKARAKAYKKIINRARKSFRKKFHKTIRNLKSNNAKDYWDLLKTLIKVNKSVK